jgi:UDP-N-acetylglucosamine 4,6-dehydratase
MKQEIDALNLNGNVSYLIGDVRDFDRVKTAMKKVDIVFNCAALKQIPACEENPIESIETNVMGAKNVLQAALDCNVWKVMHISTDKACKPINIYGACKLCAEKLFIHGGIYAGGRPPLFSVTRYGNVLGSTGSIIPVFREQAKTGTITITDERMTRFWITLSKVAQFLVDRVQDMQGGEIFIPKMPSCKVSDLAKIVTPDASIEIIGIRQGEKLHETLICKEEVRIEFDDHYVIYQGRMSGDGSYTSDGNEWQLTEKELREMIDD